MTKFMVNGKEKELTMHFRGIECSGDFIGNTSHGMDIDDEGRYIATQEDYDWWQNTISAHENMESIINIYKEKFDVDEVDKVVWDWADNDLDTSPAQVIMGLQQAFGGLQ